MPSLLEILNDPNYIDANEPTKQAIFDKYSALDKNYTGANEETQAAIRQRFGVGEVSLAAPPASNAPTGFSAELAPEQFKSGVTGMQQGFYANAAKNNAALLNVIDQIDAGKKIAPIDDVLGYQDMTPEQRKQVKDSIQSSLTGAVAKTIKYGEEQKGYKRNPYADQVISLANESNYKAAWETFKKDPTGVIQQLAVESSPNALPSLVGGAAGVVLRGGVAGLMTGLATGSFPVEFVSSITDSLRESGVDLKDEKAVEAKLRDPAFIEAAGKRAMTRGTVIAAADAASGKLLMPFKAGQLGKNVARGAANVAAETGTEMTGEAAAQLATGEELKPGDIIAEGLGAGPQAAGTTALKTITESRKPTEAETQQINQIIQSAAPQAVAPEATTVAPIEAPPVVAPTTSQDQAAMLAEIEGRPVPPERVEAPVIEPEAPVAAAPTPKYQTVGEQVQSELKDLYKQQGALLKQKDDLNVFLRKNGINTKDRSDMGIQPSETRRYAGVFRNKAQRLDVLMHSAIEKGIISEADLARFPDAVEGFRQLAKDAIDGNVAQTPQNMANQAQMQSLQDQIDRLESIPKEQYGLKAETAEESQARMEQEAAARKAQEDADIEAEMARKAEESRAEIARRSAEQAKNFALGQTPEESLTGQQRLDEDIPFFERPTTPFSDKFIAEEKELTANLRSSLDKMGLKDVGLKLEDTVNAIINGKSEEVNGQYLQKLISLSLSGSDINRTMNHEALHAMKDLGFFSEKDWNLLTSKAKSEWMKKYNIESLYGDQSKEIQEEEAIAKAFADYQTQEPKIKSLMAKALDFMKRVGNVLRGRGFRVAEDLFNVAAQGELRPTQEPSITEPRLERKEQTQRKNYLGEQAPLAQWEMPDNTKMESFIYNIQDKYIDTKRAVQAIKQQVGEIADKWDAYLKEELYHGRTAKKIKDFLNDELLPIVRDMQKNGITLNEFDDYLHNRHAEERNIQIAKINPDMPDAGSGIATADAQKYLANLDHKKAKALESMADKVDRMVQKTQKILVNAGLESQDTIDVWNQTYQHYVPLMREDLDFTQKFGGTGAGFSTKGGSSKRAMGSLKEVADIFANIAVQRERAIVRAEKARVGTALYGLAIKNPNPGFWLPVNPDAIKDQDALLKELKQMGLDELDAKSIIEEPKTPYIDERTGLVAYRVNPLLRNSDNVFPVRIDGKDRFIFFNPNDERAMRMVNAIKNLDAEGLGYILGNAAKATRWIASVNTQYNPVFGAYNFIRDVLGAQFNLTTTPIAGKQSAVTANVFSALGGIYRDLRSERAGEGAAEGKWAELWEEFQREGGATGYRDQFAKSKDELNVIEKNLKELEKGNIKKGVQAVFNWLSDYNDALENAVRLSAYKVALDQGLSKERAASIAKNLTVNFNRKGAKAQQAGALYAFFNASVQGTTRLMETLKGPQGRKIIAGGLLLGSVQALALAMAGFGDDEPPEFVKERNLVIPLPDGKYFAIPMPLGLHVIPNIGRLTTEMVLNGGKGSAKKIANLTGVFMDSFNPVGNAGFSMQTVAPTLLDPMAAIMENRDSFGRPIAKEDRATNPTPGYTRSRDTASLISKSLSEFLNYASGGTKYQKGLVSPTADQLDYLIGQATGGVGREVMKTEQALTSLVTGEELPSYKVPLVGKFYGDVGSQAAQSNKFYDNITNMANHEAEIKGRKKNKEDVSAYLDEHPEARLWQQANTLENEISKLNREKKDLISRNAPRERIQRIEEKKTQIMTRFNERVRNLEEQ